MDIILTFGFAPITFSARASLLLKGQSLEKAGHVFNVREYCNAFTIKASVLPQTSINNPPYQVVLELEASNNRVIKEASCTCVGRHSQKCKHVCAVVCFINKHRGTSKTSNHCQWKEPILSNKRKPLYSRCKRIRELKKVREIKNPLVPYELHLDLFENLNCSLGNMFKAEMKAKNTTNLAESFTEKSKMINAEKLNCKTTISRLSQSCIEEPLFSPSFRFVNHATGIFYFEKIYLEPEEIINICVETLEQNQSKIWGDQRYLRVSASSKAYKIKTRRKNYEILVNQFISNKTIQNVNLDYGTRMEKIAFKEYQNLFVSTVIRCGLVIKRTKPWICASPDGIILENQIPTKLLEIKCSISCKKKPIVEYENMMIKQVNIKYVISENNNLHLKENHPYFTQVQMAMYCTELYSCDFFIYSPKGSVCLSIARNDIFINQVLQKCDNFYFTYMLPKLCEVLEPDE